MRALLASCDPGTVNGRRDLAILLLLVRLGMRRGEVAAFGCEDIDWRAGELLVRGKGPRVERLPLPTDVGEALAGYLRDGRPAESGTRAVFMRVRAPRAAMTPPGVTQVVVSASKRAGLGEVTPHRLRHTAASELLRRGAPLVEIGQLLRHRTELTTTIYAKVDRDRLRELALPWPEVRHEPAAQSTGRLPADPPRAGIQARARRQAAAAVPRLSRWSRPEAVTIGNALAWATLPAGDANWWAFRMSVVRGFASYLHALDPMHQVPPKDLLPRRGPGG